MIWVRPRLAEVLVPWVQGVRIVFCEVETLLRVGKGTPRISWLNVLVCVVFVFNVFVKRKRVCRRRFGSLRLTCVKEKDKFLPNLLNLYQCPHSGWVPECFSSRGDYSEHNRPLPSQHFLGLGLNRPTHKEYTNTDLWGPTHETTSTSLSLPEFVSLFINENASCEPKKRDDFCLTHTSILWPVDVSPESDPDLLGVGFRT